MSNPYSGTEGDWAWDDGYRAGWYNPEAEPPEVLQPDQRQIWFEGRKAAIDAIAANPGQQSTDGGVPTYLQGQEHEDPSEHRHPHEGAETAGHYAADAAVEGAAHLVSTAASMVALILTCGSMFPGHEPIKPIEDIPDIPEIPEYTYFVAVCGYRHDGPYADVDPSSLIWLSGSTDQGTAYGAGQAHKAHWHHADNVELFGITNDGGVGHIYAIS